VGVRQTSFVSHPGNRSPIPRSLRSHLFCGRPAQSFVHGRPPTFSVHSIGAGYRVGFTSLFSAYSRLLESSPTFYPQISLKNAPTPRYTPSSQYSSRHSPTPFLFPPPFLGSRVKQNFYPKRFGYCFNPAFRRFPPNIDSYPRTRGFLQLGTSLLCRSLASQLGSGSFF